MSAAIPLENVKNEFYQKNGKWEVLLYSFTKNGEHYYEVHEFRTHREPQIFYKGK